MPSGLNPMLPYQNGAIIIELQGDHRRPTADRLTNNLCALHTPTKMALPLLATRVKEMDTTTCHGLPGMCLIALIAVTQRAGQPQIPLVAASTLRPREDMLDV
jgi:hypothetical protein